MAPWWCRGLLSPQCPPRLLAPSPDPQRWREGGTHRRARLAPAWRQLAAEGRPRRTHGRGLVPGSEATQTSGWGRRCHRETGRRRGPSRHTDGDMLAPPPPTLPRRRAQLPAAAPGTGCPPHGGVTGGVRVALNTPCGCGGVSGHPHHPCSARTAGTAGPGVHTRTSGAMQRCVPLAHAGDVTSGVSHAWLCPCTSLGLLQHLLCTCTPAHLGARQRFSSLAHLGAQQRCISLAHTHTQPWDSGEVPPLYTAPRAVPSVPRPSHAPAPPLLADTHPVPPAPRVPPSPSHAC